MQTIQFFGEKKSGKEIKVMIIIMILRKKLISKNISLDVIKIQKM